MSYEEALATNPIVASWISWPIAASGPHADEGGEILDGMYAQGCTIIEDSRIRGRSGRAGGPDTGFGGRVNVFRSGNIYSETIPTNVIAY
jgi:hypothetical protein